MTTSPSFEESVHGAARTFGWLAGLFFIAGAAGLFGHDQLFAIGLIGTIAALIGVFLLPAALALGVGLRAPAALPDQVRVGAVIAGATGITLGWMVLGAHAGASATVGALIMAASALALTPILRAPRPASWRPPAWMLKAAVFLLVAMVVVPKFEGPKPHAFYLGMRAALSEVADRQAAVLADSGHYTADLDTAGTYALRTLLSTGTLEFSATADGYRAAASSNLAPGRCAVFVGGEPLPPATAPGVVACTPYPQRGLADVGILWLVVLLGTAAAAFLFRPNRGAA